MPKNFNFMIWSGMIAYMVLTEVFRFNTVLSIFIASISGFVLFMLKNMFDSLRYTIKETRKFFKFRNRIRTTEKEQFKNHMGATFMLFHQDNLHNLIYLHKEKRRLVGDMACSLSYMYIYNSEHGTEQEQEEAKALIEEAREFFYLSPYMANHTAKYYLRKFQGVS